MGPFDAIFRPVVAQVGVRDVKPDLIALAARVVVAPQRLCIQQQFGLKTVVHAGGQSPANFQVIIQRLGEILAGDFRPGLDPRVAGQIATQRRDKANLFPHHLHGADVVLGERRVKNLVDVDDSDVCIERPVLRERFLEVDVKQAGLLAVHDLGVKIAPIVQRPENRDLHAVLCERDPDGHEVQPG